MKALPWKSIAKFLVAFPLAVMVCFLPVIFMADKGHQDRLISTDCWDMLSLEFGSSAQSEIYRFIQRHNTGLTDAEKMELAWIIYNESLRYDCDPKLVLALIMVESSFYTNATSPKGARGLMQLRPQVAETLAQEVGLEWVDDGMIYDPVVNIRLGLYYLSQLILQFKDLKVAITAYNFGPTYIQEQLQKGNPLPVGYANNVLQRYQRLSKEALL